MDEDEQNEAGEGGDEGEKEDDMQVDEAIPDEAVAGDEDDKQDPQMLPDQVPQSVEQPRQQKGSSKNAATQKQFDRKKRPRILFSIQN